MNRKTKEMVLAAILTALSLIITYSPVKLDLGFFTLTLGAHVPTLIALFVSPWVALMTIIGSCLGFLFVTGNLIVVTRAALHILFALIGIKMLKKRVNIFLIILVTALVHALSEGICVYLLTPIILPDSDTAVLSAAIIALSGTFVHHLIDSAIAAPIITALSKAKILHIPQN